MTTEFAVGSSATTFGVAASGPTGGASLVVSVGGVAILADAAAHGVAGISALWTKVSGGGSSSTTTQKGGSETDSKGDTVTSNKGNTYDNRPSDNHTTTTGNPIEGEPNSSVDILDSNGNVVRSRWFGSDGKQIRDLDYTNHGNPNTHPEWPHEHGPRR